MTRYDALVSDRKAGKKTVLIVEDNASNMKLFGAVLRADGYHTLEAPDGAGALVMARQRHPDVIIMDIQLPGISGLEVTSTLKAEPETQDIAVIATTAFALPGDEARIMAGGCDAYMAKPIDVARFLARVRCLADRVQPNPIS